MKRILCGVHAVREALDASPRAITLLLTTDASNKSPHDAVLAIARSKGLTVEERSNEELEALAKGLRHQGLIAITGEYSYVDYETLIANAGDNALIVALDEITDVHNLGAIVRSAVAMGANGVITLKDRAAPVNAAVVRSSAGATEHARIARVTNLARTLDDLHKHGLRSVGLAAEGTVDLNEVDLRGPTVLVVGSEGRGLRRLVRERCEVLARIPQAGPIASLNASVAAGIAIYEVLRQRRTNTAE